MSGADTARAVAHLHALVTALDSAFISAWQTTAAWQRELDAAREFLKTQPSQLEARLTARGYDLAELERDNPHNAWMREGV